MVKSLIKTIHDTIEILSILRAGLRNSYTVKSLIKTIQDTIEILSILRAGLRNSYTAKSLIKTIQDTIEILSILQAGLTSRSHPSRFLCPHIERSGACCVSVVCPSVRLSAQT